MPATPRPAAFLDRRDLEETLARDPDAVAAALRRLREAGYAVVVASNEPGVAAGARTEREVQDQDRLLAARLAADDGASPIDRFYWCPFSPDAEVDRYRLDHPWRKPRPGMMLQAAEDLDLDLAASWMLAGREEDLVAARAAGLRVAAVRSIGDDRTGSDLAAAVEAVLTTRRDPRDEAPTADPPEVEVVGRPERRTVAVAAPAPADSGAVATSGGWPDRSAEARNDSIASAASPSARGQSPPPRPSHDDALLAAVRELTEELRQGRAGARELSGGRVVALLLELGVLLAAVMGLLQIAEPMLFAKWFLGALLLQLVAIALLLLDRR